MDHNKNTLFINHQILQKITSLILAVIAIVSAVEWNRETGTYWGFLFLAIALPGIFLPFIRVLNKLFKNHSKRTE